ncbi:MAG: hypothetical protein AAFO82_07760 [Bacteroidota bacterium]
MTQTERKNRRSTNTWLSLLAVLVSFGAFGVSVYEAGIMREQQKIMYQEQQLMLEQQKASVWPYLESDVNYIYRPEKSAVTFKLKNKGVGPARLDQFQLRLNDSLVDGYGQILALITDLLPKDIDGNVNFGYQPPKGILSPTEEVTWLSIELPRFSDDRGILGNFLFNFDLCYCSIYNDCWTVSSTPDTPDKGCMIQEKEQALEAD